MSDEHLMCGGCGKGLRGCLAGARGLPVAWLPKETLRTPIDNGVHSSVRTDQFSRRTSWQECYT